MPKENLNNIALKVGDRVILRPTERTEGLGFQYRVTGEVVRIISNYSFLVEFTTTREGDKVFGTYQAYFPARELFRVGDDIITTTQQTHVPVWSVGTIQKILQNGDIVARFRDDNTGLAHIKTLGEYDWAETSITLDDGSSPVKETVLGVVAPVAEEVAGSPKHVVRYSSLTVVLEDGSTWERVNLINFFVDRGILHVVRLADDKALGTVFASGTWTSVVYKEV